MNHFIFCGVVLAAAVAIGSSELCSPSQWEGLEGSMGGYISHHHPGLITQESKLSYDAKNQRKASYIKYKNDDYVNEYKVVLRFETGFNNVNGSAFGKLYFVDLKKDSCWVKVVRGPFKKACIPDYGKLVESFVVGPKKGGLPVSLYEVKRGDITVGLSAMKTGTNEFIPVAEHIRGSFESTKFFKSVGYANIQAGIADPSVFDVPKQCLNEIAMDDDFSNHLMRQHTAFGF